MKKDDGGPAFPTTTFNEGGLTIRDYFAAKAMQAILQTTVHHAIEVGLDAIQTQAFGEKIPIAAYNLADEMLKQRKEEDE